jgi:hypothetical protein
MTYSSEFIYRPPSTKPPVITWTLPIKVESEANLQQHWATKHKRKRMQKKYLWAAFCDRTNVAGPNRIMPYPCTVRLTRGSPRKLDVGDNLPMAFKFIRDEIASFIKPGLAPGRADDDPKIKWEYSQESSKMPFCKVEIFDE